MEQVALGDKLWDMANYVTGFAVAQVLATSFGIARKELLAIKGAVAHWLALEGTLVFAAFYIVAIWWCGCKGSELDSRNVDILRRVTEGRIATVLLFTLVLVMALVGHWKDERAGEKISRAQ